MKQILENARDSVAILSGNPSNEKRLEAYNMLIEAGEEAKQEVRLLELEILVEKLQAENDELRAQLEDVEGKPEIM